MLYRLLYNNRSPLRLTALTLAESVGRIEQQRKDKNMNSLKAFFLQQIAESTTEDQLNYIIEQASEKIEDNGDYCELYEIALNKLRTI